MADAQPTAGRVCVVTGATSGIGRAAAQALAEMGATLALVGRNRDKGAAVLAELAGSGHAFFRADFAALGDIADLSGALHQRFDRIDVLLNNAGKINNRQRRSLDGFEETLAVNHLAPFALTGRVLDLLLAAPAARLVNIASDAHLAGRIDLDDLQWKRRRYSGFAAYAASKLANMQFTFELARRLDGSRVTVNSVHPGFVASGFSGNNGPIARLMWKLMRPAMISVEAGADTPVWAATSPELAGITGRYFHRRRQEAISASARDVAAAEALFRLSEEMAGVKYPGSFTPAG